LLWLRTDSLVELLQTSHPSEKRPSFVRVKRMGHPVLFFTAEEGRDRGLTNGGYMPYVETQSYEGGCPILCVFQQRVGSVTIFDRPTDASPTGACRPILLLGKKWT
jgi:hypothetical protein